MLLKNETITRTQDSKAYAIGPTVKGQSTYCIIQKLTKSHHNHR